MVHRSRARSSSLFLMELILAILFFSVASAVCVEFFVKSHLMSRDSESLTHAVNECAGAAEIICTAESLEESIHLLMQCNPEGEYPEMEDWTEEKDLVQADISLYYDADYMPCGLDTAEYILAICLTREAQMIEADFEMCRNADMQEDSVIYQLQAKHHIPRRTERHER